METPLIKHTTKFISPGSESLLIFFNIKDDALSESFEFEIYGFSNAILLFGLSSRKFED